SAGWSSGTAFTIKGLAAPSFSAPSSSVATSLPTFSWTPIAGATSYDLWVTNLSTGQDQVIRQKNVGTSSYTPTTPLSTGSYSAWVEAYAGTVALSPWSAGQYFTIQAPTVTAPAVQASNTSPTFTWTAIGGATRYDLWVSNSSSGQDQVIRQDTLTTNTFTPA